MNKTTWLTDQFWNITFSEHEEEKVKVYEVKEVLRADNGEPKYQPP